jgi:homoserine dehydrogenase
MKSAAHPELAGVAWTDRIDHVMQSDVDVIVEAIGGVEPAASWIADALLAGKSVVTANKQVVARHGVRLRRLAARQGRQLRFEAAVGGAIPIVRAVAEGLAGDRITRIEAILNGTTNAVLSQIDGTGCSMDAALADARAKGYAEADPSSDLDGDDARAKLAILCGLAFGLHVDPTRIPARSAARIAPSDFDDARRRGGTIRQLAHADYDYAASRLTAWVAPVVVPRSSIFARTVGPANAAVVTGAHSGETGIFGIGAGGDATSVAVLSDLMAIARDRAAIVPAPVLTTQFELQPTDFEPTSDFGLPASDLVLRPSDFVLQTSDFERSSIALTEAV